MGGRTPVIRIEKWTQTSKIRFSDNKIAWISNDDLEKPKVVLPTGRPFQVAGKPNEMHTIFDANKTGRVDNYFPMTGDMLEVLLI